MEEYTDTVKDHFRNPRNIGEIDAPDGRAEALSPACGDVVRLTFRVDDQGCITDVRCKVAGCVSTIAAASALTEMLKGLTIEQANDITDKDVANYLGGLPPTKGHASAIAQEVLEGAIADYKQKGRYTD